VSISTRFLAGHDSISGGKGARSMTRHMPGEIRVMG
jgi:hypothetical protein